MATPPTYNVVRNSRRTGRLVAIAAGLALVFSGLVVPAAAHAESVLSQTQAIAPGGSAVTTVNAASGDEAAAAFTVDMKPLAGGGSAYVGVRARATGDNFYLLQARVMQDGTVSVALKRSQARNSVDLIGSAVTGLNVADGQEIRVSLTALGSDAVALVGHVRVGDKSFPITYSDSSSTNLRGGLGLAWRYVSGSAQLAVPIGLSSYRPTAAPMPPLTNSFALSAGQSQVYKMSPASDAAVSRFAVNEAGTGSTYVGVRVRAAAGSFYLLQARITADRKVFVSVKRSVEGKVVDLRTTFDTGIVLGADEQLSLALEAQGATTVSLTGEVRASGSTQRVAANVVDSARDRLPSLAAAHAWAYVGAGTGPTRGSQQPGAFSPDLPINPGSPTEPTPTDSPAPPIKPSPSPTPTPPTVPPVQGFPSGSSTGVPAGTKLRVHEGDLYVRTPGEVVDGLEVRGFIVIAAPNVTIKNTRIVGRTIAVPAFLVTNHNSGYKFTIVDSEIIPKTPSPYMNGIMGKNFVAERLNIHGVIDGIRITGSDVKVADSWIHDNLHYQSDPNFNGDASHDDSIQIQAGRNITLTGNRLEGAWNSSVQVTQGLGIVSDLSILRNFMQDGSCTINISEKGIASPVVGVSVRENTFGAQRRIKDCAVYGPLTTKIAISDNVWSDGSKVPFIQKWW